MRQVGVAVGGQFDAARQAAEQAHAEPALQVADPLAHRRLGQAELLGRRGEVPEAPGRLEDPQPLQRRKVIGLVQSHNRNVVS